MSTTITIRTDAALREALVQRASVSGKTVSGLVREILEDALADRPFGARAGHLKGRLTLAEPSQPWEQSLRQRNWRR